MIPLDLQSTLVSEIETLFQGQVFPAVPIDTDDTPDPVPLNIFTQAVPYENDGDITKYAPYVVIQLQKGGQEVETEAGEATLLINIAIRNDDSKNQGHIYVCNIIETIRQYMFLKRTFANKYYIKLPFEWQINDEDVAPYYFGSIETHWNLPIILPDDINL